VGVLPHHMSAQDEQILEEKVEDMLEKGIKCLLRP
jgi:hypothetical protein